MTSVLTVTLNPAIDQSTAVDRVVPEQKLRCEAPRFEPGGGGLNVARVLARIGGESLALWTSAGPAGAQLSGLLDDTGIPHRAIEVSGLTRTNVVIYEHSTGRQYRFGMPGPELTAEDLEAVQHSLRQHEPPPDVLVLSGSLPPGAPVDLYARLIATAAPTTKVVLDTSGPALGKGLEASVHLVKPNLRELGEFAGRELEDDAQIRGAAEGLLADGRAERVVVSLGAGGAMAVDGTGAALGRAPTVPIVSKVGAGDSMVGGMVSALTEGLDLAGIVRRGVAAGAAAVMTPGSELCRPEDVRRLEGLTRVTLL